MDIKLEQREINIILDALSTRPYNEVAALIRKIVEQTATNTIKNQGGSKL